MDEQNIRPPSIDTGLHPQRVIKLASTRSITRMLSVSTRSQAR